MIIVYVITILLAAFPLWKTIRYIRLEEKIRREGISTSGVVTYIHTTRLPRNLLTDRVHTRFASNISGGYHEASFASDHKRYRVGQSITVRYLPGKPDKIVVAEKRGYWPMLIFSIILLLFAIFGMYKINETVNVDGRSYQFRPPWKD